jgi:hypothetical protein
MAETTIATERPGMGWAAIPAAMRMRSADPTLVPPNFITSSSFN